MIEKLQQIRTETLHKLQEIKDEAALTALSVSVLGRNGALTGILRSMGQMEKEERASFGQAANQVKQELEEAILKRREELSLFALEASFARDALDVTEPGRMHKPLGRLHPMTQTYREIRDVLIGMGFTTFGGPEVEYEDYNFTKLNILPDHPSRDMQDTFYVDERVVLRTHTSPCQVRALFEKEPPFRIITPGRVFRVDEVDASHSPVFMQIEGLVIDRRISFSDLSGTLDVFVKAVFGENVKTRLRPSYFPFTEPSAEVDISCTICGATGCRVCKGTGWLEVLGCGVTNPHIIENCGLDPKEWKGVAFGIGVDRVTNLKYGISDIRLLYENDARFLKQF